MITCLANVMLSVEERDGAIQQYLERLGLERGTPRGVQALLEDLYEISQAPLEPSAAA